MATELVVSLSMATSSLMRTSRLDTLREVNYPWLMQAQTLMDLNSSSLSSLLIGNQGQLFNLYRLDGAHVVFGELIEGENILRQLELVGTRNGNPTAKIVIDDCGEIARTEQAAK